MIYIKKIKFLILICFIIIIPVTFISFADNYYSDKTTMYIGKQIELASTQTFKEVINHNVLSKLDSEKLVNIHYNSNMQISSVIINTKMVNQILSDAHIVIDNIFKAHLEEYFQDLEIPIGTLISKSIFSNLGPVIKIPITPVGAYHLDILTTTTPYGINNSLIEVFLDINVDIEALIPLQKKSFPCNTKIVILSQVIQGEIPKYYYSSGNEGSFPYIPDN